MSRHCHCQCRPCRQQRRKGKILGSRLLRHLGANAHFVSAYVRHFRWNPGRRPQPKD